MAAREKRYEHGEQTFVCLEEGPSEGPVVVLVHGFPDQPGSWSQISSALVADGYRVIAPWLRGYHPDTIVPGRAYAADVLGDDLVRLLGAATDRPAVAVGHDWGASLVWAAGNLAPEVLAGIVPVAIPHARALKPTLTGLAAIRHFATFKLPTAEATARRNDFAYLDVLVRRWAPTWDGPDREALLVAAKALFADGDRLSGALDYYRGFSPRPIRALTDRVTVPGLLIVGSEDFGGDTTPAVRSAEVGFERGAAARTAVIDGVGHWPHLESPEAFLTELRTFLGKVLPV